MTVRLIQWWRNRHRHSWIYYGFNRACKRCSECGYYRCEDGSSGRWGSWRSN